MTLHIYDQLDQGTPEWHDARRGIVTASVVGKLLTIGSPDSSEVACPTCAADPNAPCISAARKTPTPIKTHHDARVAKASDLPPVYSVADNETSQGLTLTLAAERIAGWTEELPMTSDMWRGCEAEPYARDIYSGHYGEVTELGFMRWQSPDWTLGYSPDGLVGEDGLIEIKAPRAKTHVRTILADEVPAHYMPQLQAGLLVSGRKWIDYVSYVAGLPLYVKRVEPDEKWHDAICDACLTFEANVAQIVADYTARVADMPKTDRLDFDLKVA